MSLDISYVCKGHESRIRSVNGSENYCPSLARCCGKLGLPRTVRHWYLTWCDNDPLGRVSTETYLTSSHPLPTRICYSSNQLNCFVSICPGFCTASIEPESKRRGRHDRHPNGVLAQIGAHEGARAIHRVHSKERALSTRPGIWIDDQDLARGLHRYSSRVPARIRAYAKVAHEGARATHRVHSKERALSTRPGIWIDDQDLARGLHHYSSRVSARIRAYAKVAHKGARATHRVHPKERALTVRPGILVNDQNLARGLHRHT